uniref:Uncharacterized protein n=1 Tax=Cannabis sativa TaxID=3483 RepID=A0A803QN21_CANSA
MMSLNRIEEHVEGDSSTDNGCSRNDDDNSSDNSVDSGVGRTKRQRNERSRSMSKKKIKININPALFEKENSYGFGIVARDHLARPIHIKASTMEAFTQQKLLKQWVSKKLLVGPVLSSGKVLRLRLIVCSLFNIFVLPNNCLLSLV